MTICIVIGHMHLVIYYVRTVQLEKLTRANLVSRDTIFPTLTICVLYVTPTVRNVRMNQTTVQFVMTDSISMKSPPANPAMLLARHVMDIHKNAPPVLMTLLGMKAQENAYVRKEVEMCG